MENIFSVGKFWIGCCFWRCLCKWRTLIGRTFESADNCLRKRYGVHFCDYVNIKWSVRASKFISLQMRSEIWSQSTCSDPFIVLQMWSGKGRLTIACGKWRKLIFTWSDSIHHKCTSLKIFLFFQFISLNNSTFKFMDNSSDRGITLRISIQNTPNYSTMPKSILK